MFRRRSALHPSPSFSTILVLRGSNFDTAAELSMLVDLDGSAGAVDPSAVDMTDEGEEQCKPHS
jgi:hypothetical protein